MSILSTLKNSKVTVPVVAGLVALLGAGCAASLKKPNDDTIRVTARSDNYVSSLGDSTSCDDSEGYVYAPEVSPGYLFVKTPNSKFSSTLDEPDNLYCGGQAKVGNYAAALDSLDRRTDDDKDPRARELEARVRMFLGNSDEESMAKIDANFDEAAQAYLDDIRSGGFKYYRDFARITFDEALMKENDALNEEEKGNFEDAKTYYEEAKKLYGALIDEFSYGEDGSIIPIDVLPEVIGAYKKISAMCAGEGCYEPAEKYNIIADALMDFALAADYPTPTDSEKDSLESVRRLDAIRKHYK